MAKNFLVFLIFLSTSVAVGRQTLRTGGPVNVLNPLGYNRMGSEFLASGASGVALTGLKTAPFVNPAGILFTSTTITAEFAWRPKTNYFSGWEYDNIALLPSFVAVGMPLAFGSIQAGYCRSYDEKLFLGNILFTTESQPEGIGVFADATNTTTIHAAFAGISLPLSEDFLFGITIGYDFIKQESSFLHTTFKASGGRIQVMGGAIVKPIEHLNIGLTVEFAPKASLDFETNMSTVTRTPNTGDSLATQPRIVTQEFEARSPIRIAIGAALAVAAQFELLASTEYENWSAANDGATDVWQYHFGANVTPFSFVTLHVGFFTQRYPMKDVEEFYNQQFLTAGISWLVADQLTLTLSYLSSRPYTTDHARIPYLYYGKSIEQSALQGGASFLF